MVPEFASVADHDVEETVVVDVQNPHSVVAALFVAAHWAYKEGRTNLPDLVGQFPWLGELVKEQADQDSEEFLDLLKSDLFQGEVFVFTPKGEIKVLPRGATPIDFAYQIHTEHYRQCRHG